MDGLRQDLRSALRLLRRDPWFAAAAVLTLAVCLGAHTAVFAVVRSVLLRPLPYPESDRLVFSFDAFPGAGVERAGTSVPNYLDRAALADVFDSVALYQQAGYRVGEGAEGVPAMNVTPSFFRVLRARALRGRLFGDEEGTLGRHRAVVLSQAFAALQPGGVDGVVGRQIRLDDEPFAVIGVLPAEFAFLTRDVRVFVPLAFTDEQRSAERRYTQNHQQIARLAPGVTLARAQARIDVLNERNIENAGRFKGALVNAGYRTRLVFLHDDLVRDARAALRTLWGGVAFVVLIAAVNLTNLSLVRASGRAKELATRSVLGAGRRRIARQLVSEALLLSVVGWALGLVLAWWGMAGLGRLGLADLPRAHEIRIDGAALSLTGALALGFAFVMGAVPAARGGDVAALRDDGRGATASRAARSLRGGLVVAQVALAFVLLMGAGLLLASFQRLVRTHPGFVASQVLTGRVSPLAARYPDATALRSYVSRALERVRALPGVAAAGVSSYLPFSWDASSSVVVPEGYKVRPGDSLVSPNRLHVTPGYLEALRVPLVRGRFLTEDDGPGAPRVVLVDERLARRFWPGEDPVGRRLYLPSHPEDFENPGPNVVWLRVVGVVGSVKLRGLVEGENARAGAYYLPYDQDPSRNVGFALRTGGEPGAVAAATQKALAELDPQMPMFDVLAMSERVERSLNPRRAPMLLATAFGAVALLLATIGIYGVLAYQVSQRTREIGVRMALGSGAAGILRLVLGEGARLAALGLGAGLAGALALRGLIASQLYGVGALDPGVLLGATGALASTCLAASIGPALRAARLDPIAALSGQ